MTELYVKRQKLAKDMRKMEIESYFKKCRNAMENKQDNKQQQGQLTLEQLEKMYLQLQKYNDSIQSVLNYISIIKLQKTSTISSPIILVRLKKLLNYLNNGFELQQGIESAKVIISNLAIESIKNPKLIENCLEELLQIVIQHKFKFQSVWPEISLIRHQVFFQKSFIAFMRYIHEYEGEIDPIVGTIVNTFANFTSLDQQYSQVKLTSTNYVQIVDTLTTLFQNFTLGSLDLKHAAIILKNIINLYGFEVGLEICSLDKTMKYFVQAIDEENQYKIKLEDQTLKEMLELIGMATSGSNKQTVKLISSNPSLVRVLSCLLPIQRPFKKFITPGTIQWIHTNEVKIMGAFLSLSNLAALQVYGFQLLSNDTLKVVVEMSRYPSDVVKGEVAIFIWNLIIANEDEHTEIFCQSDILSALSNVLKTQHCYTAIKYGIKSIGAILKRAKHFPLNNIAWIYNSKTIKSELMRNQSVDEIQRLMWSKSKQIREEAEQCLKLIKEDSQ